MFKHNVWYMLRPFAKMLSLMKHCLLSKNGMTNSIGEGNCELMLIGGYLKEPSTANSRAIAYTRQPPLFFPLHKNGTMLPTKSSKTQKVFNMLYSLWEQSFKKNSPFKALLA